MEPAARAKYEDRGILGRHRPASKRTFVRQTDAGSAAPALAIRPWNCRTACIVASTCGRLSRPAQLLRAKFELVLAAVPHTRFILIGRDRPHCPGSRTHQQYADDEFPPSVRRQITFAGALNDADVTSHLQSAEVFVAPSLYESFGLVFLEAMRWGTPVVGTRAGGIPEIIKDRESGLLVSPGNHAELAEAISSLIKDPEMRRRLGESGRRRVEEEFSATTMASRTADFYLAVVKSYARRRS